MQTVRFTRRLAIVLLSGTILPLNACQPEFPAEEADAGPVLPPVDAASPFHDAESSDAAERDAEADLDAQPEDAASDSGGDAEADPDAQAEDAASGSEGDAEPNIDASAEDASSGAEEAGSVELDAAVPSSDAELDSGHEQQDAEQVEASTPNADAAFSHDAGSGGGEDADTGTDAGPPPDAGTAEPSCGGPCPDGYEATGQSCVPDTCGTGGCACSNSCGTTGFSLPICTLSGEVCPACEPGFERCVPNGPCLPLRYNDVRFQCGSCGNYCGDGTLCQAGVCVSIASVRLAETPAAVLDLVLSDEYVYWSAADGALRRIPTVGGAIETLASGLAEPARIVADAQHVYFVARSGGAVMRVPKEGGAPELIATAGTPHAIALDDGHVYWSDALDSSIMAAPKSGGAASFVAFTRLFADRDIRITANRIAADEDYIYYAVRGGADSRAVKITKAGVQVAEMSLYHVQGVTLDADRVYLTGSGLSIVDKDFNAIAHFPSHGFGESDTLAFDREHVYYGADWITKGRSCDGGSHVFITGDDNHLNTSFRHLSVNETHVFATARQGILKLLK